MWIGELAKVTGCPVETIRYYEKEKVLPSPPRSQSNYRRYTDKHVKRLQFIRHCRIVGLSLNEIKTLIEIVESDQHGALQAHEIITSHIAAVDKKMAELRKMRKSLTDLAGKCHIAHKHDPDQCEIIDSLQKPDEEEQEEEEEI